MEEGRAWNEIYLLRAFLQFNPQFEVLLFGSLIAQQMKADAAEHMPALLQTPPGAIWLRRVG